MPLSCFIPFLNIREYLIVFYIEYTYSKYKIKTISKNYNIYLINTYLNRKWINLMIYRFNMNENKHIIIKPKNLRKQCNSLI